jgi:hypothetical protein
MATCTNCGSQLSCGCQRRQATNGQSACANCINSLEKKIADSKNNTK